MPLPMMEVMNKNENERERGERGKGGWGAIKISDRKCPLN